MSPRGVVHGINDFRGRQKNRRHSFGPRAQIDVQFEKPRGKA